jgi:ferredoxin-NADP reductase/MOSC domain-containing protein YiiM
VLSVNVGVPRDVEWRGRRLRTAIWKFPVDGRRWVARLNVAGDDQADRVGHGGEHRAVFVYQLDSYRYWERELGRGLDGPGQFGENLTVTGLADDEVRIGDRLRVGGALLEVTQPRVTCFKVGVRLDEPRMPALLTGHGRPGFYARVLEEGEVGAGDPIDHRPVAGGMTVREVSDLLYLPGRAPADLRRALTLPALSEGWRGSFRDLLARAEDAAPRAEVPPAWSGFRPFVVADVVAETADVRSFVLEPADGGALPAHLPGQFVTVRLAAAGDGAALVRSYSLSARSDGRRLRISVKRDGVASALLHDTVAPGTRVELGAPRGSFTLEVDRPRPVVLVSAGIGVTPVLAMLAALAHAGVARPVTWLHAARSRAEHAFAAEARTLLAQLPGARAHVHYTRPGPDDRPGETFDHAGRLTAEHLATLGLPADAHAYVCGPDAFMRDVQTGLVAAGLAADAVHTEAFGAVTTPAGARPRPHPPERVSATGPAVVFARSGLTVRPAAGAGSLLDLAEACDVPARWSCRTGVCHLCVTGLVEGAVRYDPEPLEAPAAGTALLCCSVPDGDVTLDL